MVHSEVYIRRLTRTRKLCGFTWISMEKIDHVMGCDEILGVFLSLIASRRLPDAEGCSSSFRSRWSCTKPQRRGLSISHPSYNLFYNLSKASELGCGNTNPTCRMPNQDKWTQPKWKATIQIQIQCTHAEAHNMNTQRSDSYGLLHGGVVICHAPALAKKSNWNLLHNVYV